MLALRWIVGVACALALGLFLLILMVGKGLASAYRSGASTEDFVRTILPVAIPVLLVGMLLSAIFPRASTLLHIVGGFVVPAFVACLFLMRERPGEGAVYAGFFALWLLYYGLVLFGKHEW